MASTGYDHRCDGDGGQGIAMPRAQAVPQTIAAGCDMFLFTRNLEEDFAYEAGCCQRDHAGTPERRADAHPRSEGGAQTVLKPALVPTLDDAITVIGSHQAWAAECATKGSRW
ncbi:hypothetical protein [Candidatus Flexifilum breve]|uniref:hypothetical protein n=1 Tax=Candidatus Flexifilum breve TaxID=3140694 RepID=UPI0031CC9E37